MSIVRPQTDGDLIADILRRLGDLERSSQAGHTSIGAGGLRVLDGGTLRIEGGQWVVTDANGVDRIVGDGATGKLSVLAGGEVLVEGDVTVDGGVLRFYDSNDVLRVSIDTAAETGRVRVRTFDETGGFATAQGELIYSNGDRAQGFLVEGNNLDTGFVGPVQWDHGSGYQLDGVGITIDAAITEALLFFVSQSRLYYDRQTDTGSRLAEFFDRGEARIAVGQDGEAGTILGGQGSTATSLRAMLRFPGSADTLELQCKAGGGGSFIAIAASAFTVRTSTGDSKDDLGVVEAGGATDRVAAVPVHRWRHRDDYPEEDSAPGPHARELTSGVPPAHPVRTGPMVEDLPDDLVDGDGIVLTEVVWTLWRAVQETTTELHELRAEVAELRNRQ